MTFEMKQAQLQAGPAPSVNTLMRLRGVHAGNVQQIRQLMKGELSPETVLGEDFYSHGYGFHLGLVERVMDAIDVLLGTRGVEGLTTRRGRYLYCNTGETYEATVVRCTSRGTWRVATWGDIAEREGGR
jgi:hypothetical protein